MRGQPDYPACTVFAKGLKVHVNPKFHYIFGSGSLLVMRGDAWLYFSLYFWLRKFTHDAWSA